VFSTSSSKDVGLPLRALDFVDKESLRSGAPTILSGRYGHGRTGLKLDFEVRFGLTNGFYFGPQVILPQYRLF
jgi:hypothetical protein